MRIPDEIKWDSFDDEETPNSTYVSPYDRIRVWFEQGGSEGYNPSWARLMNPAVDAYVTMREVLGEIADQGQEIDEWPEEYDAAPLLRRARRLQRKQD